MHKPLKNCPHHNCSDVAIIKDNGYVFAMSLKCGARGPAYSIDTCGHYEAEKLASKDWNLRTSSKYDGCISYTGTGPIFKVSDGLP